MITSIWNEIRIIRRLKGGSWVKTKERGWIKPEAYNLYISYRFDPVRIKTENWV
jgi:hypothetical protein